MRDFIYVNDIYEAFWKACNKKIKNQIFNIGAGKPISINYLVSLLGKKKIFIPKRPSEPDLTFANINKAKKILKWQPKISIDNGIKLVLKNIDYWKNAPLWTKSNIKSATKMWFKYFK